MTRKDLPRQNFKWCSFKDKDLEGNNFSKADIRGTDFTNANLRGANFSKADIRGANFTNANLRSANFSHVVIAGVEYQWAFYLALVLFLFVGLLRFFLYIINYSVPLIFQASSLENQIASFSSLSLLITFFFVTIILGIEAGLKALLFAGFIVVLIFNGVKSVAAFTGFASVAVAVAVAIVGSVAVAVSIAIFTEAIAATLVVVMIVAVVVIAAISFAKVALTQIGAVALIVALIVILVLFSFYIGWQAMKGDEKYSLIRNIAVAIAAFGGTSFRNANLTDANFTGATLKSTDFRKANLTRTCFNKTKKLDRVRPGTTYLQNAQLRKVLVTGQGQDKNFDREDLRGVNFQGANLVDASFMGADLSQANLQDADLSRAKLVQAQLNGTDFTGATLTGAYIQDWGITTDTNFDGVRCEYVYMRLPTKENPQPLRKPDNHKEVFADGEFGDFIKPIFDTLDLYHNQDVDPRAIAISFKQLAENYPDAELEIVAMEKRGEDKFLLRAKTAARADKSQLSAEYFDSYNEIKGLPKGENNLLLAEKDSRIRSLETMVITALQSPKFYAEHYNNQGDTTMAGERNINTGGGNYNESIEGDYIQRDKVNTMTNNPGSFSIGGSVGGNVNNVQGDNNRAVQGDNNQAVLGDNNQVTQQNQVGADTAEALTKEDIVKLLAQLETLIQGAELPADTKEEVIEDLSAAKKATDKEEPNKKRALDRLTTVTETLEKTTKTVDSGKKLWNSAKPIIVKVAGWLGAAAGSSLLGL
ncbi:pentapeptide repeat-containing protein [Nodularia sp. NIES-3585]|uniref:pentapeptide repeat-containing protein n=1 Tax=Nodularia sp. NIES-3585 TaxID=1973477 RepID=UPI000B5C9177|nr:pentapeptide repeat-containing protein [Nodularia sp. NIES-3585]